MLIHTRKANMQLIIILLFVEFTTADKNLLYPKRSLKLEWELAKFAANAYHNYCEHCRATLVLHDENDATSNMFLRILARSEFNMSLVSVSIDELHPKFEISGHLVGDVIELTFIFWNKFHFESIDTFLETVKYLPYWNYYSKMVFILSFDIPGDRIAWIENTFRSFWTRKILRVFICFWSQAHVNVYMYDPFLDVYAIDVSHLSNEELNVKLEYELFDMYGYPLKTYTYDICAYTYRMVLHKDPGSDKSDYIGLDGRFLNEVQTILNVSLDLFKESQEDIYGKELKPNEVWTANDFMESYDFDIWFTALRANKNMDVEYIFLHERDDLCFVLPRGKPIPAYLNFLFIIPPKMWVPTTISFILVVIILHTQHYPSAILDTFRIILGAPLANPARPARLSMRILLASWIGFSLTFSVVFQCTLTSTLVVSKFYSDINTFEELANADITVYASEFDFNLLKANFNDTRLLNKIQQGPEWTLTHMLASQGSNGFMVRSEMARLFLKLITENHSKRAKYNIMLDHPVPSAQAYIMPKGHPYFEEILWIINKVHESGVYYKWRNNDFGWDQATMKSTQNIVNDENTLEDSNNYVPLTITHLQFIFYLLLIGLGVSSIVFLIEYLKIKHICKYAQHDSDVYINL